MLRDITKKMNIDSEMGLKISVLPTSTLSMESFLIHPAMQTIS